MPHSMAHALTASLTMKFAQHGCSLTLWESWGKRRIKGEATFRHFVVRGGSARPVILTMKFA